MRKGSGKREEEMVNDKMSKREEFEGYVSIRNESQLLS